MIDTIAEVYVRGHPACEANGQMQTYCVRGKVTLAPPPCAQKGSCVHPPPACASYPSAVQLHSDAHDRACNDQTCDDQT